MGSGVYFVLMTHKSVRGLGQKNLLKSLVNFVLQVNGETVAGVGRVGDRMIFYNTSSPSREIVLLKMKQNGEIIMCDVIKYGTIEI